MRRPQFTLKTMLWSMVVVAMVCSLTGYGLRWWRRTIQLTPYPAMGTITIDGREPAARWVVTFSPNDWSWGAAVGTTDKRGNFELMTPALHMYGACPGSYLVGLVPAEQSHREGFERYSDPNTSGLKTTVKPDANVFRFDLITVNPETQE
jgi:hypothetical protein